MEHINNNHELNHLFWKDEILQVMYWMFGEKLGEEVQVTALISLLNTNKETLEIHLNILLKDGYIEEKAMNESTYKLTEFGKKEAGKRFAGAFQGLQKAGHGECGPDCDCQWEGNASCQHHVHDENCNH